MGFALQKTLTLVLLIFLGFLLKSKIKTVDQVRGIKVLILSIALPATIFIALLKIDIQPGLFFLPILALGVNFLLLAGAKIFIGILGIDKNVPKHRTLAMLMPSLAPGLSCFPFITEYAGEQSLALAALADVGNKFFVLILLYLLAMHWYYRSINQIAVPTTSSNNRLKELLLSLVNEPINLVLLIAIGMLCLGLNLQSLPNFIQDTVTRLSALMTPLVLLFIGLAVKIRKGDLLLLVQVLCWRSGFAFLVSALLLFFLPPTLSALTLLVVVVFPQSACSFWPFAHMTAIKAMEKKTKGVHTFDLDLGLNLLAFSLPFSTIIILSICILGDFFLDPWRLIALAIGLLTLAFTPMLWKSIRTWDIFNFSPTAPGRITE